MDLEVLVPPTCREPFEAKSFLLLFFKKEALASLPARLTY
jgi:hypothetical protein